MSLSQQSQALVLNCNSLEVDIWAGGDSAWRLHADRLRPGAVPLPGEGGHLHLVAGVRLEPRHVVGGRVRVARVEPQRLAVTQFRAGQLVIKIMLDTKYNYYRSK